MKSFCYSLLMLSATSLIVEASSFNGFYAGAGAGWAYKKFDSALTFEGETTKFSSKRNDINASLFGGWGRTCGALYLGGELSLGVTPGQLNKTYTFSGNTETVKHKRSIVLGVAPRIGTVFAKSMLAYLKLGLELSRDKFQTSGTDANNAAFSANKSQSKVAFAPGVGLEKAFGNVITRLEYSYNLGSKMNVGYTGSTDTDSVKYKTHNVQLGVAYKF